MVDVRHWVWVFDDQAGLNWVLDHQIMVFSARSPRRAREIQKQDLALLYMTRGAVRGTGDTPSQIVGVVRVTGSIESGDDLTIEGVPGRTFRWRCPISVEALVPLGNGPSVRDYVERLELVREPKHWGQYFRGSPIEVSHRDFEILELALRRASQTS